MIIKVDGIDLKVLPVQISFELKGRDAALSTKVVDAHIARIERYIRVGGLSGLIKHKTILWAAPRLLLRTHSQSKHLIVKDCRAYPILIVKGRTIKVVFAAYLG